MGIKTGRKATYLGGVALFALGMGLTPIEAEAFAASESAEPVKPVVVAKAKAAPKPAQDQDEDEDLLEEEDEVEEIITTGSRIRRSTFTSISPLQVIDGAVSRESGLFNTGELLQNSTAASGQQINNTFGGFVLDNGFGAQTLAFRGLGAERTLVLINGRRLVSAGNGGAPGVPDLSLIPNIAFARAENILDGASAVYGSDAIAGVTNIILRDDVDGFEFEVNGSLPESGGAEAFTVGAMWGDTGDNYSITVAAEYFRQENQSYRQNAMINDCPEVVNELPTGERIRGNRTELGTIPGTTPTDCAVSIGGNIVDTGGFFGSLYYTPGTSNFNIPGISELTTGFGPFARPEFANILVPYDFNGDGEVDDFFFDGDGDGAVDINFGTPEFNYFLTENYQNQDFVPVTQRFNIFTTGTYNLQDDNNTELYGELSFARRETDFQSDPALLFIDIPASNPFNPFGVNGTSPNVAFFAPGVISAFGLNDQPIAAGLRARIRGDRDNVNNSIDQYRGIVGIRGGIGFMDDFLAGNWEYDASFSYQRSEGFERRTGVSEERALETAAFTAQDANGNVTCTTDTGASCVPINFFEPRFYGNGTGELTQEEADYLLINRDVETVVEQTVFNAYISGDLFTLPWNDTTVPIVLGYEYRDDTIATTPNDVTRDGLVFGFFRDLGANGSRDFNEIFAETSLTLLQGLEGAELFQVDLGGRYTKEEFSPGEFTYSIKAAYKPVDWFTFRGTYGTSFRAPNLRERFINGLTGFLAIQDPCIVPEAARDQSAGPGQPESYDATGEFRDPRVLASCAANGVDPTTLGLRGSDAGFNDPNGADSTEVATVGNLTPEAEESTAWTIGAVFEQPFTDAFQLSLSASYWDVEIRGGVNELAVGSVLGQCYDNEQEPTGGSDFCQFIERDSVAGGTGNGFINFVGSPFINAGLETAKGVDFNLRYQQDFEIGSETLGVSLDTTATYLSERFFDVFGTQDDNAGEQAFPHWRAQAVLQLTYSDLRVIWNTRWIQGGQPDVFDPFDDNNPGCAADFGVVCRDIDTTDNYDVHNLSFVYRITDEISLNAGVQNLFDARPSEVTGGNGVTAVGNFPLGIGYDPFGRSFFAAIRARF